MTTLQLNQRGAVEAPLPQRVISRPGGVEIDGNVVAVRAIGNAQFIASLGGRSERLTAATHGDVIHVQLKGRAFRVDRIDATRSRGAGAQGAAGAATAPMPGVVISLQATLGQSVRKGDALLVIESMKLQMTIEAAADGVVTELPFTVGHTFQRGAVLVRTAVEGATA